jgi:hypothetical protein
MERTTNNGAYWRYLINGVCFALFCHTGLSQQNNTLFFMHSLPEANYLNPAVQINCGIFVGLPVISSVHVNIANSGFKAREVMYTDSNQVYRKTDMNTNKLGRRNYFVSELHTVLLAVGVKRHSRYYSFTITEKDNSSFVYTRDLVSFILRGSDEFEGHEVTLKGTKFVFNHYREFALGVSQAYSSNLTLGIKAKLLFGKYNLNTGDGSIGMNIQPGTQNIDFTMNGTYNSSMPYALRQEAPGIYRSYEKYDAPLLKQLMNRRNPGFALDVGFIYDYDDRWTLSGSLLDLGLILYRSNLFNYTLQGNYLYTGSFGQGPVDEGYFWDVFDSLNMNMNERVSAKSYVQFLDPKLYLGAAYHWKPAIDLNLLLYNRLLPGKLQSGATVSALLKPTKTLSASISWSYMNRSAANLGAGLAFGYKPLQFYVISDNVPGLFNYMNTKNINIRFGLNLNLGCRHKTEDEEKPESPAGSSANGKTGTRRPGISDSGAGQCGCAWIRNEESRRLRIERLRHGKK